MLRRIDKHIWRLVDSCLFIAVVGLVVTISLQVISRIANHSTPWTEEFSRFLFIWTAFIGMATGFRTGEHPRVDFIVGMLPPSIARPLRFLTPVSAALFFGIAGWYGYALMRQQLQFGETSPTMGIGMWVVTLPIVIGSVLSILGSFVAAIAEPADEPADAPAALVLDPTDVGNGARP